MEEKVSQANSHEFLQPLVIQQGISTVLLPEPQTIISGNRISQDAVAFTAYE